MTTKEFQQVYEAKPFRPFAVHVADGRAISVRHQEFAMLSPSGRTVIVYQPDDSFDVIDLLLVTTLRVDEKRSGKGEHQEF